MRKLDGVEILSEEKIKAENLHGLDLNDRELIFKNLLPEENFVDRRIHLVEDVPLESESEPEQIDFIEQRFDPNAGCKSNNSLITGYSGWRPQGIQLGIEHEIE